MEKTSSLHNVVANYLGSGYATLIQIVFVPVYIRYLGIEAYGLIGLYTSLQVVLSLMDMGITPMLIREMARYTAGIYSADDVGTLLRTVEVLYSGLAFVILGAIVLSAPWVATHWLRAQSLPLLQVSHAVALMGALIAIRWFSGLYRGAILGLQHQVWLNAEIVVFSTIRAAGIVLVLKWWSATLTAFFTYQAAITLLEIATLFWRTWSYLPNHSSARYSNLALAKLWRFSAGVTLSSAMSILLMQSDKLLLSKLLPLRQYGYYMLASTVAGGLSAVVGPLSNASYPRLAELVARGDGRLVANAYHRFSQALSIALTPAALMLAIFSERIVTLWTHNPQTAALSATFTSLLALGYFLNGVMHNPYNLQLAYGWTRFFAVTNLIATIAFLPAIYFGVSYYGATAAAYIWICINASYLLFAIPLMHRKLLPHELSRWYLIDLLLPSIAAFGVLETIHYLVPLPPTHAMLVNLVFLGATYACTLAATAAAAPLGRLTLVSLYGSARRLVTQFV